MLLTKMPGPVPLVVLLLLTVGFCDVFQHTPLAVIVAPPSLVILPPDTAAVAVMPVIAAVVSSAAFRAAVVR
jgi:hypothetical protein